MALKTVRGRFPLAEFPGAFLDIEASWDEPAGSPDVKRLLGSIAMAMRGGFKRAFELAGPGWAPLAPSTIRRKLLRNLPPKNPKTGQIMKRFVQEGASGPDTILIATGALRDSYVRQKARGHVEELDATSVSVEVGTSIPYASAHQDGVPFSAMAASKRGRGSLAKKKRSLRYLSAQGGLPARPVRLDARAFEDIDSAVDGFVFGLDGAARNAPTPEAGPDA